MPPAATPLNASAHFFVLELCHCLPDFLPLLSLLPTYHYYAYLMFFLHFWLPDNCHYTGGCTFHFFVSILSSSFFLFPSSTY